MSETEIIELNISQEEEKDICEEYKGQNSRNSYNLRRGTVSKKPSGASVRKNRQQKSEAMNNGSNKRVNASPESINEEAKVKRTKSETNSTYSDIVKGLEVIIKPVDYPETLLDPKGVIALEKHLLRKIDLLKVGEVAPQFHQRKLIDGYWRIKCIGSHSKEWLENVVAKVRFRTKFLHLIDACDLIEKPKCRVFVPGECSMDLIIMHRFKVQNKGFDFSTWRVVSNRRSLNGEGRNIIVEMAEESVEELRKLKFYLANGLTQVKFHLFEKELGGKGDAKTNLINTNESMEVEDLVEDENLISEN